MSGRNEADLQLISRICETVHSLVDGASRDQALAQLVRSALESPRCAVMKMRPDGEKWPLTAEISDGNVHYGWYAVAGRTAGYGSVERARLADIAKLTGSLFAARDAWSRQAIGAAEEKLRHQAQILDQIHDSVITMDPFGFITGWNKGAERLFGYKAEEVNGRNILFLYADETKGSILPDEFLHRGGHEMEVRRRKKSGETFWASLSLSRSVDASGRVIGLTGFLTDISDRKHAEERIHNLAYYDTLTGLPNRTLLCELADKALARASRNGKQLALLFIDLNRFKPINDTLGHEIGNRLLQEVARRLRDAVRSEDAVARLGGDEFVVGLLEITRREQAGAVAEKLLNILDAPFFIDEHELRIGGSIGISIYPDDGADSETLLRLADIAMYRTKQGDHGGFAFYSQDMNRRALDALKIETGLRRALERDELLLHYQPKVALADGRLIGAEALVRWQHPDDGLMPPDSFIPVAEETGLIVRLGAWVLDAACRQAGVWRDAGLAPLRVAVNLSAREFVPSLPARVREVLDRHRLTPEWLELEITESMLMHSSDRVIVMMDELAAMGVTLSLDDFGTGFSSLSYLKRFPIHTLKIDRSFINGIPGDANDNAIAAAIISMGKQLKHRVIAEGVENEAQLDFLSAAGCDEIQGFVFSRPVPAADFEPLLRPNLRLQRPLSD
jgi:diguanylate cyclase (GGDEF)-like protein/PAS domain S-box-containing protein